MSPSHVQPSEMPNPTRHGAFMTPPDRLTDALVFPLQEIPEGSSQCVVTLTEAMLDPKGPLLLSGDVRIQRFRAADLVMMDFTLDADVRLVCDRSLESFTHAVEGAWSVEFSAGGEEREEENRSFRPISPEGLVLDLNRDVRDTILLGLPTHPLHPKFFDEQGNPIDFEPQVFGSDDSETDIDPRWEKLKHLRDHAGADGG